MLSFDGVTKRHGHRTVLTDVTFRALPGRVTAFLGPNGAGKSSALRILLGLDRASSGAALVNGRRYRDLRTPLRTVGALLEGSGAHPSRTARAHLAWVARSNGIPGRRVDEVLERVGLAAAGRSRVRRFSLGMGQRLGLAAALLGEPEVLVLDEPANGLDPAGLRWLRELLRGHADGGGTVLLSSHQIGEVASVADDLAVIAGGRVLAHGSLARLTAGHDSLEGAYFAWTGGAEQRPGGGAGPLGGAGRSGNAGRSGGAR
ncbi:ATP-binding cassette domain-containing protein [Streptomyces sp. 3MP-14]|uniref:ATP-binding cassette domain-containing protein n=1 Tax=Streptomyces mimosae TaxID=2586635 RepID=A0A5N6ASD6_9ACTN|nr:MULTISPECIES: ATP-binding cassette domain-containing protein [Streptomyces]KAB8170830.1 ATP-binding cassette domain-containing protein [Streptomyces mimosae]KAB8179818.1 ATP-binding cassette domain-containing protein [Streptomyces sp. 3MP-14]